MRCVLACATLFAWVADATRLDSEHFKRIDGVKDGVGDGCGSGGACIDTSASQCTRGRLESGLCDGPTEVRCCLPQQKVGVGSDCGSGGTCIDTETDKCDGALESGLCQGPSAVKCCSSKRAPAPSPSSASDCGDYAQAATQSIDGNGGVKYTVVKILARDLTDPSSANALPTAKDNTFTKDTACAFARLKKAANSAGHRITINSGFRTLPRQQYFWNLYKSGRGNLAAQPGTSNHGRGIALDLQLSNGAYAWMTKNGDNYGFIRTVKSESWHWEYRPGSRCNAIVSYSCS